MRTLKKVVLSVLLLGTLLAIFLMPEMVRSNPNLQDDTAHAQTQEQPALQFSRHSTTAQQDRWIEKLSYCESGHNQNAINPRDLDGTPSLGEFQFKVGTWKYYVKKYDLFNWKNWEEADWQNSLMSGWHQEVVLTYMIYDKEVDFSHEFPQCVRLNGLPPRG